MPHSTAIFKKETFELLTQKWDRKARILDIGCGAGTYADLLRSHFYQIDGVEVFEPYVDQFELLRKYNNLYVANALDFEVEDGKYDIIIMGDVLEHIEESAGIALVKKLYGKCKELLIGIPFNSEQGVHFDNTYEIHLQPALTNESFLEKYEGFRPFCLRYDYALYIKDVPDNIDVKINYDELYDGPRPEYWGVKVRFPVKQEKPESVTLVTGLWNIGRDGRAFDHYISCFDQFLDIDCNMILFLPEELHAMVWKKRNKSNTFIKTYSLNEIRSLYDPHMALTQAIRLDPNWYGQKEWLKSSPQAALEMYNPIVQSKMFMLHEASIWSPFDDTKFAWLDAGIMNTVHIGALQKASTWVGVARHIDPFLFLSYPYDAEGEIHGFRQDKMDEYSRAAVKYVCRGGFFGGTKDAISQANGNYYSLLQHSLYEGLMGTEESLFTIMSYLDPDIYRRYILEGNGMIYKFFDDINEDGIASITASDYKKRVVLQRKFDRSKVKTDLYFLTFNMPKQIEATLRTYQEAGWLGYANNIYVFDNSTDEVARAENAVVCLQYGCEHMPMGKNVGINGGRVAVADHFALGEADYYMFFEDDMTINNDEEKGNFCRNGFRKYVPELWDILHKIMIRESYDYIKLTFTEVFMDNHLQVSWYNVRNDQDNPGRRAGYWPDYHELPRTGLDPNCPRTDLKKIDVIDELAYVEGEIYYCNWPMIMSREGNRKTFLVDRWAHPNEQTFMSHVFMSQKRGEIKAAVLLASPITHDRFQFYKDGERIEG